MMENSELFIAYQYADSMNDEFSVAALLEIIRFVPMDFFALENYTAVYENARAYLMI